MVIVPFIEVKYPKSIWDQESIRSNGVLHYTSIYSYIRLTLASFIHKVDSDTRPDNQTNHYFRESKLVLTHKTPRWMERFGFLWASLVTWTL